VEQHGDEDAATGVDEHPGEQDRQREQRQQKRDRHAEDRVGEDDRQVPQRPDHAEEQAGRQVERFTAPAPVLAAVLLPLSGPCASKRPELDGGRHRAATSAVNVAASGTRRSRHWRLRTLNSISATLSQLPCLG
jgi:hypothetical protein